MTTKNRFGTAVRKSMRARCLKLVELADYCGVNPSTLSSWLNGDTMPTPNQVKIIALELKRDSAHLEELLILDRTPPGELLFHRRRNQLPGIDPEGINRLANMVTAGMV